MKLFFGGIFTETNTFAPFPSGRSCWQSAEGTLIATQPLRDAAQELGWECVVGPVYVAQPLGITPRPVYETMRDELLEALRSAVPVDAVQLFLHGAMVADGYPDCEGDLLAHVRKVVGADTPVGAELDLHAHVTAQMQSEATLLVGFKEYPHTDIEEQMLELLRLLVAEANNETRATAATFDCRMLDLYPTTREPMRSFVDKLRATEQQDKVLNAWLCHGFPYGDVSTAGTKIVVTTDADEELAISLAEALGREFYLLRNDVRRQVDTLSGCIEHAAQGPGPITIADTGDNPGGGAPCDSTFALQELLRRGLTNCAVGPLYDPSAVQICFDGGIGATLALRIGGKHGPASGQPLDVRAHVTALADEVIQSLGETLNGSLGRCAAIRIHADDNSNADDPGIDIVLSEKRFQAMATNLFTDLSIEPGEKQILIVKSTQHFHASFAPVSTQVLYAGDLGALQGQVDTIEFQNLDTSTLWPFCTDPLGMDT